LAEDLFFGDKMAGLPHATIHEYSTFGVNKHGSTVVYDMRSNMTVTDTVGMILTSI
jgi:hypothetical protein